MRSDGHAVWPVSRPTVRDEASSRGWSAAVDFRLTASERRGAQNIDGALAVFDELPAEAS